MVNYCKNSLLHLSFLSLSVSLSYQDVLILEYCLLSLLFLSSFKLVDEVLERYSQCLVSQAKHVNVYSKIVFKPEVLEIEVTFFARRI